jgi:hypothetical protein
MEGQSRAGCRAPLTRCLHRGSASRHRRFLLRGLRRTRVDVLRRALMKQETAKISELMVEFMAGVRTDGKGFYSPLIYVLERCRRPLRIGRQRPVFHETGPQWAARSI